MEMTNIKSFQKRSPEVRPASAQGVPMRNPERPPEPRGEAVAVSRRTGRTRLLSGKPLPLQAHGLRGLSPPPGRDLPQGGETACPSFPQCQAHPTPSQAWLPAHSIMGKAEGIRAAWSGFPRKEGPSRGREGRRLGTQEQRATLDGPATLESRPRVTPHQVVLEIDRRLCCVPHVSG